MAKPKTVLWAADEHTLAKHQIVREYLKAWLPILARWNPPTLLLIDGFAGPGIYEGGEPGSPILMVRTLLEHSALPRMRSTTFKFLFIEQNQDRYDELLVQLAGLSALPPNVTVIPVRANYADVMGDLLGHIKGFALPPTFAFIDPFGYNDTPFGLTGQILSLPRCEALIYVPLVTIARFVEQPGQENVLNSLFGDDSWKAARGITDWEDRQDRLHDLFATALGRHATYVRSFEMRGRANNTGYHLFFASSSPVGLRRMKTAMWLVDPVGGMSFKDSTVRGQDVFFTFAPDLTRLRDLLRAKFGFDEFTIEAAANFTLFETPYRDDGHLKELTLAPAERDGFLTARKADGSKRRAASYPDGTILRFTPVAAPAPAGAPVAVASRSTHALQAVARQSSRSGRPTA